jgi:formylglycine-generating enzyme required for sulfatase activity
MGLSEKQMAGIRERLHRGEGIDEQDFRKPLLIKGALASLRYEKPQRVVELETFYVARFPITHQQCDEFFATYPHLERWRILREGELANFPEEAAW